MTPAQPLDRCDGATSARGQPLPCCIQCQRRHQPVGTPLAKPEHRPVMVQRVWTCDGQVPFAE